MDLAIKVLTSTTLLFLLTVKSVLLRVETHSLSIDIVTV